MNYYAFFNFATHYFANFALLNIINTFKLVTNNIMFLAVNIVRYSYIYGLSIAFVREYQYA